MDTLLYGAATLAALAAFSALAFRHWSILPALAALAFAATNIADHPAIAVAIIFIALAAVRFFTPNGRDREKSGVSKELGKAAVTAIKIVVGCCVVLAVLRACGSNGSDTTPCSRSYPSGC